MEKNELSTSALVEVVYSPAARIVSCKEVDLTALAQEGALEPLTVQRVLLASGMLSHFPELSLDLLTIGIWGKRVSLDTEVKGGDRLEIYRDLIVDPKEARRLRDEKRSALGAPRYRPGYKRASVR